MFRLLEKLANYLDKKGMVKEANMVDNYLCAAEETWNNDLTVTPMIMDIDKNRYKPKNPLEIKLDQNTTLNLQSHPLGKTVTDFVKKVYKNSDSERSHEEVLVTVKDIQAVVKYIALFDQKLNQYDHFYKNKNPITPAQLYTLFDGAHRYVGSKYLTSGVLNQLDIENYIETLIQNYKDFYNEHFAKAPQGEWTWEQSGEQYDTSDYELTQSEKQELFDRQDKYFSEQEEDPIYPPLSKGETPKNWDHILFPNKK